MKITPLEIRQKEFEKKLRGYDKDEVTAFLLSLSNEWERVLDTNKELTIKLQHAEKEVAKLREVESSLYKTLKTAEDTGANLIDQSNKAAELHMKETQMRAEGLMNEAKSKAKGMMEKAEVEARQIIEELQEAVKDIEQNHRNIENHRQNALAELKNLSVDLIEKVERTTKERSEFKFDDYAKRVKALARESGDRIKAENTELVMPETPKIEESIKEDVAEEPQTEPEEKAEAKPAAVEAEPVSDPEPKSPEPKVEKEEEVVVDKKEEKPKAQEETKPINKARISRTVIPDNAELKSTEAKLDTPPVEVKVETKQPEPVIEESEPEPEEVHEEQEIAAVAKEESAFETQAEEEKLEEEEEKIEKVAEAIEEDAVEEAELEEKEPAIEEPVAETKETEEKEVVEEVAVPVKQKAKTVSFFDELDED